MPDHVVSFYPTGRRRYFITVETEKRLQHERLDRKHRLEIKLCRRRDTHFTTELEEIESSSRFVGLILARLARQENAWSELLETENDNETRIAIENKREKARIEIVEALNTVL